MSRRQPVCGFGIGESIRFALSDLRHRPLVTLMLIVTITIGMLYALIFGGIGVGLVRERQRAAGGLETGYVIAQCVDTTVVAARFTRDRVDEIAMSLGAESGLPLIETQVDVIPDGSSGAPAFATLRGSLEAEPILRQSRLIAGRAIRDDAREVVLSRVVAEGLLRGAAWTPQLLSHVYVELPHETSTDNGVLRLDLSVVGVVDDPSSTVFVPLKVAASIERWRTGAAESAAETSDLKVPRAVFYSPAMNRVDELRRRLIHMGYSVRDSGDGRRDLNRFVRVLLMIFGVIVGGSVVCGVTTTLSLTSQRIQSRIHEIGVLKSLGLRSRDIFRIYALESLMVSAAAFAGAVAAAALIDRPLGALLTEAFQCDFDARPSVLQLLRRHSWLPLSIFGAISFLSILGTGIPTMRAVRLRPADAFRRRS